MEKNYRISKYPDGTSYVEILHVQNEITFKINSYEDLHHLEQLVDAHNNVTKVPLTITIPNLLDAQADRRFGRVQSSGLKLILKRLNSMGANFKIFHPHNPEVVEALMNNVEIIDNSKFINKVLKSIRTDRLLTIEEDTILMSSDAGGFKPLMKLCDKINWQGETFSASKARFYNRKLHKSELVQIVDKEDFEGKDILIIDDICVYGGTFKGLAKLLKERNCGKIYLAVSHMTLQNLGEDPVTNYFDKVFTTDSKFDEYEYNSSLNGVMIPQNLEIIKLF